MKKNILKKAGLLIGAMAIATGVLTGCSSKEANSKSDVITIGIGQFAEHGSLDNCREGFIEGLKNKGFEEGKNLKIMYDNAQADGGLANQIISNFIAKKVDMICGIATPMAQAAYGAARKNNIPVIFTAVTDPIAAQLANDDKSSVGEITGTSDKLPVKLQLEMIRKISKDAKKIGIIYCTSEVNSVSAIEEYKKTAPDYGFEIVEKGISVSADIPLAADALLKEVDCISNLTDNTVVSSLPIILSKAKEKNIPVYGSEVEQVKIGCLATVGLDYYQLGIQTGEIAGKVLKGEVNASEIPFETIEEANFYYNSKVANELKLEVPKELVNTAKEIFS